MGDGPPELAGAVRRRWPGWAWRCSPRGWRRQLGRRPSEASAGDGPGSAARNEEEGGRRAGPDSGVAHAEARRDVDLVHAGAGTSQRRCGAGLLVHEAGDAGGLGSEGAEERRRWRGLLLDPRDEEEDGALVPELAKQDGGGLRRSGRGPGRSGPMVRRPWRSLRRRRAGGSCPRQREIPEREMDTEGGGRTREGG